MPKNFNDGEHEYFSLDHDQFQKDLVRLQAGEITDPQEIKQTAQRIKDAVHKGFYDWPEVGMTEKEIDNLLSE